MSSRYHEVYASWQRDPEGFWAEAAREIDWYRPWDKVFDPYAGQYGRWFSGAECNTAWNCLDRHVERGRAQQKALIYDSPVTKTTQAYTYAELRDEVATLAGVLHDLGVRTGVDDVRSLAAILIQADRFGASIAQALRVQSDSMRTRRRQIAEEKAAKTAVQLIFPLVLFIFPGIFVVLVGPAAINIQRQLLSK